MTDNVGKPPSAPSRGEPDPIGCRVAECPMTAQACDTHRPDPQVGDEVVLRGIVTQRATDTLGRDIVQVTRGRETYWFARADHAEPVEKDSSTTP